MASSLLESLSGLVGPSSIGRVAGQLGESEQSVSAGMQSSFAAILAGLVRKATDASAMQQVAGLISQGSTGATVDPAALSPTTAAPSAGSLLSTLFGGNTSGVTDVIAQHSGLKPSSATSILTMAAPLVLGVLGNQTSGGLSAGNLASTLLAQKDSILAALPAGLGSILGLGGLGEFGSTARDRFSAPAAAPVTAPDIPRVAVEAPPVGNRWVWALLGIVVALLLLWLFFGRNDANTSEPAAADTTHPASAAMDSNASATAALGALVKQTLPDGTGLNIPSHSYRVTAARLHWRREQSGHRQLDRGQRVASSV